MKRRVPNSATPYKTYFITTTVTNHARIFSQPAFAQIVIENLNFYIEKFQAQLHSFVLMPSHMHLLLTMGQDGAVSKLMGHLKGYSAKQIIRLAELNRRRDLLLIFQNSARKYRPAQKHQVWQARFDDLIITNGKTYRIKLDYIHNNPCAKKWRLAERPEDYPYSSARFYIRNDDCGVTISPSR